MRKRILSFTPTPLHKLDRLSEYLGVELWMKRDDLTGDVATGGNKIRKLEYLLAEAIEQGADTIITTGGPQSNHAKATAALAVKAGLQPVLILAGLDPGPREANLFINQLVGAEIRFSGARTAEEMEEALARTFAQLKAEGKKPYLIPIGGSNGLGSLGYLDAYQEIASFDFDWVVVSAGSGGTYAGLYLGLMKANKHTKLVGFSPWLKKEEIKKRVQRCLIEAVPYLEKRSQDTPASREYGEDTRQLKIDIAAGLDSEQFLLDDRYIGAGYGKITPQAVEAIQLVAQKEAIILDHVYTGKAMAGLIDYRIKGVIAPNEKVLFWHTGGAPGLFAIQNQWQK